MTAPRGPHPAAGRLDPTVRALLRAFLSPPVADRYASALQPIAVADRDAAVAGAVSAVRVRFGVPATEVAVVLVEDTGWSVADVATLLGMSTDEVLAAVDGPAAPRVGDAPAPADAGADEAAEVEALLAGLPTTRRRPEQEADLPPAADVELSTSLPAHVGLPSLEERIRRADRSQRRTVNATIAAIVVLVALTVQETRVEPVETLEPEETVDVVVPRPTQDPEPEPTPTPTDLVPVGPARAGELRFVDEVDPSTGRPGDALGTATVGTDVRVWLELDQRPQGEVLLELSFEGPDAGRTVRPVLVPSGLTIVSVRLPEELGRLPGRYRVTVLAEGSEPSTAEIVLEPAPAPDPTPGATEDGADG